MNVITTVQI